MALNALVSGLSTANRFAFSSSPVQGQPSTRPGKTPMVQAAAGYAPRSSSPDSAFAGDSYLTLGVRPGSSKQDIKQAYRRLALQYHPDVCKGEHCAPKFKQINAAYEMLQKMVEANAYEEELSDDEDDEEVYKSGWEGAWVF